MGNRANIYLVDTPDASHGIYLYTHYYSEEWPERLRSALVAGKNRWGDESYLARIIASRVFSDIHSGETGGGISTWMPDNTVRLPILICDLVASTVAKAKQGSEGDRAAWVDITPFANFVATVPAVWKTTAPAEATA